VSADDAARRRTDQPVPESRFGRQPRDDLFVAARRTVAEERRPETVDIEDDRFGKRRKNVALPRAAIMGTSDVRMRSYPVILHADLNPGTADMA
jgi:hypothetical protein